MYGKSIRIMFTSLVKKSSKGGLNKMGLMLKIKLNHNFNKININNMKKKSKIIKRKKIIQ